MSAPSRASSGTMPIPLLGLFGLFLVAIAYLVAASLAQRRAVVFAPSPPRPAATPGRSAAGDTLTIDASDGDVWRYVSLEVGGVLTGPDTARWDLAVQRYRIITARPMADAGRAAWGSAVSLGAQRFVATVPHDGRPENPAIAHWYKYNLLTHLLEPNGHLYLVQSHSGALWKMEVLSYYCPGLKAGCLTVRFKKA